MLIKKLEKQKDRWVSKGNVKVTQILQTNFKDEAL